MSLNPEKDGTRWRRILRTRGKDNCHTRWIMFVVFSCLQKNATLRLLVPKQDTCWMTQELEIIIACTILVTPSCTRNWRDQRYRRDPRKKIQSKWAETRQHLTNIVRTVFLFRNKYEDDRYRKNHTWSVLKVYHDLSMQNSFGSFRAIKEQKKTIHICIVINIEDDGLKKK